MTTRRLAALVLVAITLVPPILAGCGRQVSTSPLRNTLLEFGPGRRGFPPGIDSIPPEVPPPSPPPIPAGANAECLSDSVLIPGTTAYALYALSWGENRAATIQYRVVTDRAWDGFPI